MDDEVCAYFAKRLYNVGLDIDSIKFSLRTLDCESTSLFIHADKAFSEIMAAINELLNEEENK